MKALKVERPTDRSSDPSLWDDLAREPLLEETDIIPIERSFARRLFGGFYEHIGSLILLNLAVSLQVLVGGAIGLLIGSVVPGGSGPRILLAAVVVVLFAGPAFAGLFNYVRNMSDDDARTTLSDYLAGMRKYAKRSWVLLSVQAATGALLILNFRFYSSIHSLAGTIVLLLILLLTALWAMAGSYAWPLLVRDLSWRLLARNSFFLGLAAPASTLAMVVLLTLLSAVLVITKVGVLVFLFPVWAVTENVALMRLVRKFRARQEAADTTQHSAQGGQ
ncbi:MAG: hypothetical protein JWO59_2625 [Chloroflexi bacterium]|jgi:uncharacterized membrane protein YesL|nr:hypothetical protein [Chloroflexota bacterium]